MNHGDRSSPQTVPNQRRARRKYLLVRSSFTVILKPLNSYTVCGAETALAEIEPHPLHVNFQTHGYICDRCKPVKSFVVRRSWSPGLFQ